MEMQHEILHLSKDSVSNQNFMSQRLNDFLLLLYVRTHNRHTLFSTNN